MKKIYILLALSFCFLTFQTHATVYRVKTAGTSTGTGTWASPMDLQTALVSASADNAASSSVVSEVWIAQGTYYPTLRPDSGIAGTSNMARSFYIDHDVEIYGGFQNSGTPAWADRNVAAFPVILSGDLGTTGTNTDNCNSVFLGLNLTDATIIDGLTIQDGYSDASYRTDISYNGTTFYGASGSGMYLIGSDPILNNLVFQNNSCSSGGGGIMCTTSSPTITNVVFWKNNAVYGGALHAATSSYPIMTFITFYANTTTNRGGAVYINSSSTATIINTIFSGNTGSNGPDIYRQNTNSSFYITKSMMQRSSGSYTGTNYTITTATALIYSGAPSFYNAASTSASLAGSDGLWMSSDDGLSLASSSSSAYQYGTTGSGIPTTDITGATRGTTPCIGAYEVYASSSLPVDLVYFEAKAIDNQQALLNWQTASELNNNYFDVERSYDAIHWEWVGKVVGNGTTTQFTDYSFVDKTIAKSQQTANYRLNQIDYDGANEYTDIRSVRFTVKPNAFEIAAYPNPFNQEVTIRVNTNELYSIEVTDLNGLVMLNIENEDKGTHSLDLSTWASGVYIVNVTSTQGTKHLKVIKQ